MYQASAAFHAAAMAENAGELLLRFANGTVLTTEDVKKVEITYPLNEETDVTAGKCVSAELKCTVLNYHGLLSGFAFGKCSAAMGAKVSSDEWTMPVCKAAVVYGYGTASAVTVSAHEDAPFLRVDGSAGSSQPLFSPECLVIFGNTLYAADKAGNAWAAEIGENGTLTALGVDSTWGSVAGLTWEQASAKTWEQLSQGSVSAFMGYKLRRWAGKSLSYQNGVTYEFTTDGVDKYEYVPLGTFYFDTPEQRKVASISCEALDGMQKFNVDVDDWWAGLTWPMTRGQLLQSLCTHVGVTLKTTTFPGSDVSIASAPAAGNGFVGKDVLGWIAETACSYARMSRDDQLELVWFATQNIKLTQSQHFGDSPAEYETPSVQAVHVMVANTDLGVMLPENGTGNEYQVLDNPLLYGATEAEIREKAQSIYDRIVSFPAYTPNAVDAVCDWSIEAGDIIQVVGADGETRKLPIFRYSLTWGGGWARATYECTGGKGRKPASQAKRREFSASRAYHKLEVDISGIHSEIGDVKGNVATLEVTASELSSKIEGKVDGDDVQSLIDQTLNGISLSVTSGSSGSTFTMTKDGVTINSNTVSIQANSIDFNNLSVSGKLSASNIDAANLTVTSAMIDTLVAGKIVGGAAYGDNGYIMSGAISGASHALDSMYVDTLRIMGGSNYSIYAALSPNGIAAGGKTISWSDLVNGGGAVFG